MDFTRLSDCDRMGHPVHKQSLIHRYRMRRFGQSEIRVSHSTPKTNRKLLLIEELSPVVTLVPLVA